MDFHDLFPKAMTADISKPPLLNLVTTQNKTKKFFVEAIGNVRNIPDSQLPTPCVKGDQISILIPEDEYLLELDSCKHNLHGRIPLGVIHPDKPAVSFTQV